MNASQAFALKILKTNYAAFHFIAIERKPKMDGLHAHAMELNVTQNDPRWIPC